MELRDDELKAVEETMREIQVLESAQLTELRLALAGGGLAEVTLV